MCSNTSSTSGTGVSGSSGGGGGGDGDYASLILKKPKRQRVPKRGPGVAELEKILREQENKNHADEGNVVPFVPVHSINHHFNPPPPPMTMLYSNGGKNINTSSGGGGNNGGNNGFRVDGSGIMLPGQALLPTVWSSCQSSIYEEGPKIRAGYPFFTNYANGSSGHQMHHHSPLMLRKKRSHQYLPPTINLFPNSGSLSSSDNNTSAGFYVHLEPPSNQRSSASYHNYSSLLLPEEDKIVGTKQPRTFPTENNSGPPIFQCQVSSPFSHMHTLDQSPSSCNHNTASFNLKRDETVPRNHTKMFITENGTFDGNFFVLGSQATPSQLHQTSQQEFSKHSSLPFQESMEGSQQKKPFYSFLIPEEQTAAAGEEETTLSLNSERAGTRETVDLNLKL